MLASVVQAQNTQGNASLADRFARGRGLFLEGQYGAAIEVLRPLSRIEQGNPYVEYASFYFGLSALKDGQYDLAKNMFLQINSKYPKWEKTEEVNYWLANTYFNLQDYEQALALIKEMDASREVSNANKEDAKVMKNHFLDQATTARLQELLALYPEDKDIATNLVKNIAATLYDAEEQELMDSLIDAFNIDMASLGVVSKEASVKKNAYNVAVFLPFLYDKLNPSAPKQGNQFVLDLYKGIKMAASDLQSNGINVQLHAYDTERSFDKMQSILQQDEIRGMDLMIGPLYPGPYRAATEYAMSNQKYMFNPLSSNPAAIGENPFAYLIKPSLITEGRAAARFAIDSLNRSHAVVITGATGQDSLRVSSFAAAFEEDGNRDVIVLEEENFNRERIEEIVEMLNELGEDNLIYVASGNELIISNTISAVVMAENQIPVIGSEEWLETSSLTFDQLENFDEYLIAPGFIDPENANIADFKDRFRREFYDVPNKYTYVGYDLMMYIGYMLDRYGVYFQEFYTGEENVNSLLYAGYNYFNANDNQLVPIIKYEDAQLKLVDVRR
jgi:hypothetical protein